MTEEDAKGWIADRFGLPAQQALQHFVDLVFDEGTRQNLISTKSADFIWTRHIVDSAQLIEFTDTKAGLWIDIGTGAGFPGVVTALLSGRPTLLVEPRRRRVEFLERAVRALGLTQVHVRLSKIETVTDQATTISARAVSSVAALLESAAQCADASTKWLLPKGKSAREEVAEAKKSWHGAFHVEHSITDPESLIVVASGVSHR